MHFASPRGEKGRLVLIGIGLVRGFDAGFEWTSWLLLGLGALIVLLRTLVARGS